MFIKLKDEDGAEFAVNVEMITKASRQLSQLNLSPCWFAGASKYGPSRYQDNALRAIRRHRRSPVTP
jgi:hypothetical protein